MHGHIHATPIHVPAPRAAADQAGTPLEALLQTRRRVAMAVARRYLSPPGMNAVSERTGTLLDRESR
jgi:hypothetical protein